jgi:hypothetical protein
MTGLTTSLGAVLAAAALALGGSLGVGHDGNSLGKGPGGSSQATSADRDSSRTALVIDASRARDGRELVDPRLRELDAEVRLPRTSDEARTNVRYFDSLGYHVVVAGPDATAAATAVGVDAVRAAGLPQALAASER